MAAEHLRLRVLAVEDGSGSERDDSLAVEAPLEIRLAGAAPQITMRTPGHDLELCAGLLLSEGLVRQPEDILDLRHATGRDDVVEATLQVMDEAKSQALQRSAAVTSACGVCGKRDLAGARLHRLPPSSGPRLSVDQLTMLPLRLRAAQGVFEHTGGLHAAALFDSAGKLLAVREDVGRHNALDKLLGWALVQRRLPLHDCGVLLSGRASYELLQKAITAGVAMVCAISAPSSYAVRLAREFGVTLIGFLRGRRFNVYATPSRIIDLSMAEASSGYATEDAAPHSSASF